LRGRGCPRVRHEQPAGLFEHVSRVVGRRPGRRRRFQRAGAPNRTSWSCSGYWRTQLSGLDEAARSWKCRDAHRSGWGRAGPVLLGDGPGRGRPAQVRGR